MSDQWYYRTRGQELGPVSEETLRQLIGTGVLSRNDMVCVDRGSWRMVGDLPFFDHLETRVPETPILAHDTKQKSGPASSSAVRSAIVESHSYLHQREAKLAKQSSDRHRPRIAVRLPEWGWIFQFPAAVVNVLIAITSHMIGWLMGVARPVLVSKLTWGGFAILVTSYLAYAIPATILTQAETHTFLSQTVTEFRRLREEKADEQHWQAFSRRTHQELSEIVPKLEQAARTDDPVSMEYLFLARDYLPLMIADSREQPSEAEQKFDIHMDRVERVYAVEPTWSNWIPDWHIMAIILLVGFLLTVCALWKRSAL